MSKSSRRIFQEWLGERMVTFHDQCAVESGPVRLTFGDIDRQSDIIANWILDRGIEKETYIGIYSRDRIKLLVSVTGILKAGCAFVPLDPALPGTRLQMMVETVGLTLILRDHTPAPDGWGIEFAPVSQILNNGRHPESLAGKVEYSPDDRVYVYFTSGTTGIPKAIVGKNKSLHHFVNWEIGEFQFPGGYRFSQVAAPGFDAFLKESFVAIGSGGVLCIPEDPAVILNPDTFSNWVDQQEIHVLHCVPSVFRLLTGSADAGRFKSLKYVLMSGEPVQPAMLKQWYDTFGGRVQLVNLYGLTETTILKTMYRIQPEDTERERIPIGMPMKGSRIVILDDGLNICQQLTAGEIYIRTPYLTHGYHGSDQLTSERFIPNPLSDNPNDIVFKTGDLGRLLPDGNIEFLGRKDRQVKIRGIRVELEEIETILHNHPYISEAAVIKKELPGDNDMLCAYAVKDPGTVMTNEQLHHGLKGYLGERLPEAVAPSYIRVMDEMPKQPNGKTDYRALPDPFADMAGKYVPPTDHFQERLVGIWCDILHLERVGIRNRYFELGGNSLNLITLISYIQRDFNVTLTIADLFRSDTIESQALLIRKTGTERYSQIFPQEAKEYYTASSVQRRLYFLQKVDPENMSYNMPRTLLLEGDYDISKMETVFLRLIQRHESFRTSFDMIEGETVQRIHPADSVELNAVHHDIHGAPGEEIDAQAVEEILDSFIVPFNLAEPPLWRVCFIPVDDRRLVFAMDTHHVIADGTSQAVFIKDFLRLYNGEELPPLRIQYKDYSLWLDTEPERQRFKREEAYWLERFKGEIPLLDLPADFERSSRQTFEGGHFYFDIGPDETKAVKRLGREENATLFMMLLAVFNVTLYRLTGVEDIVTGVSVAGRRHPDLEALIGMFVNTVALRNNPAPGKTFREFLREVRENTLGDFDNQDFPLENLLENIKFQRVTGRNPLFDVMIMLNNEESPEVEIPGLVLKSYPYERLGAQMDLRLRHVEIDDHIHCYFEYSSALFREETIQMFVDNYKETINLVTGNPDIKLEDVTLTHGLASTSADTAELEFDF